MLPDTMLKSVDNNTAAAINLRKIALLYGTKPFIEDEEVLRNFAIDTASPEQLHSQGLMLIQLVRFGPERDQFCRLMQINPNTHFDWGRIRSLKTTLQEKEGAKPYPLPPAIQLVEKKGYEAQAMKIKMCTRFATAYLVGKDTNRPVIGKGAAPRPMYKEQLPNTVIRGRDGRYFILDEVDFQDGV